MCDQWTPPSTKIVAIVTETVDAAIFFPVPVAWISAYIKDLLHKVINDRNLDFDKIPRPPSYEESIFMVTNVKDHMN